MAGDAWQRKVGEGQTLRHFHTRVTNGLMHIKPKCLLPKREKPWKVGKIWQYYSSVQLLSCVWLFATPWTAAHQASLSITNSWSLFKFMSIQPVMPSNNLILRRPLLLLPSVFPSIRIFFNDSVLCIRRPKY